HSVVPDALSFMLRAILILHHSLCASIAMPAHNRAIPDRIEDLSKSIRRKFQKMPTPCGRCKRLRLECQVEVSSGRCTICAQAHKTCDLRVTFQEFQKLAGLREKLERQMEEAEQELSEAEERSRKARAKVRRIRKVLRRAETTELKKFEWEVASLEEAEKIDGFREESPAAAVSLPDQSVPGNPLMEFPLEA
ncbi:hypothetical protein LTR02_018193, partial [Friedmanniomyces endolithicus]